VNNAHQAMTPGGGTLRLRTALGGDRARVIVEDTGPGVPPEFATRVFDPFFTTRGVGGGAGLGLAVVFGTVSAHGGRVWVEPAPGRGARFVIELPVAAPVEAPSAEPAAPETPASPARAAGQRVLIVDDEESIRVLASQVLTAYGYEPVAAASATEALALLDERPFEAVLTDIRMPGMDGIEFYGELARRWPALASHVVIMTGDVENDAVARLIREHALASLEKPFKLEALLAALATAAAPRQN
jgi:CheY-like chemotaxis protein